MIQSFTTQSLTYTEAGRTHVIYVYTPERTLHAPPMNLLSTWFNPPFFPSPPSFLPPLSSFRLLRVPLSQRPAPAAMTPNSNALEVAHVPLLVHSMASSEGVPRLVPRLPVFKPSTPTSQDVPRRHVQPLTLRASLKSISWRILCASRVFGNWR